MENYVPQSTASATNNQPHVFTDSFSMPTFSHQYATPVFLSFPPPCTFGPADYSQQLSNNNQDAASNAVAAGGSQIFVHRISEINSACNQQSCASQSNDRVVQMADSFASLNMDDSHGSVPRPDSTSSTGTSILDYHIPPSYSVVLPSATILHHLGANIPSHVYQQFSPVITQNVPQFHSVYPLNTVDPGSHPAVTTNILATQPLSAVSSVNDSQTKNLPNSAVFSSHLMEATWPVHPPPMSGNPSPLFWSQYVHNPDKNHNIPLSSQPFLRRHSVCEESAVTPTNVCPPCNLTGIVSATPEFIHPRKPDVPQWLMSPPVGEQDPSIISYAPMMYRNVRGMPSVTGIALVTGINVESPLSTTEAPKMPSPILISSPLPCYDGTAEIQASNNMQPNVPSAEAATQSCGFVTPCSVAEQQVRSVSSTTVFMHDSCVCSTNDFSGVHNSHMFSSNCTRCEKRTDSPRKYRLMFPGEFSLNNSSIQQSKEYTRLLSPLDFDSGYSSSKSEYFLEKLCNIVEDVDVTPSSHSEIQKNEYTNALKLCSASGTKDILSNEGYSYSCTNMVLVPPASFEVITSGGETVSLNKPSANQVVESSVLGVVAETKICQESSKERNKTKKKKKPPNNDTKSTVIATLKDSKPEEHDLRLVYSHLLGAAVNLATASGLIAKNKKSNGFHKTGCGSVKNLLPCCTESCLFKGPSGQQHLKRVVELQQSQCWQFVTGDKTPDVKHPLPDLFNRWPNIPPPPPPPPEAEDNSNEAMALATTLFPSESNACSLHNGLDKQEEDVPLQQTYPIGVFWDIENCAVPTGKSAHSIVKRVRERFFAGHKEAEFMCVCDINKESKQIVQDLNNAQVNVVHISATAKNAADDKLRQSIRRFAHNHPAPATLVLITGDSNFTSEVSDLRHRHKYFVVLIHPTNSSQALIQAATTVICYEQLVADLPVINYSPKDSKEFQQLLVANLPRDGDPNTIRNRLLRLSENCGGKVVKVLPGTAVLRFASMEAASRAIKRLDGENILGNSISVCVLHQSPRKGNSNSNVHINRNMSNNNSMQTHQDQKEPFAYREPSNAGYRNQPDGSHSYNVRPMINLTPGHCDPPGSIRSFCQPPQQITPAEPATTFSFYSSTVSHPVSMQCNHPSQIITHHDYNSMPPPPQPQLFQPVAQQFSKEDMQQYGVKLTISNIDAQLGIGSIQDTLCKIIVQHCQILDMRVRPHNRFTVVCDVTVPHVTDASRVLQHLQRQKIGTKRVLVTLTQQGGDDVTAEDYSSLKRDCFSILKDCGQWGMQLFKFLTLYEKRYHRIAKLDDIRSISDVIFVHDGPTGTVISINPKIRDEHMLEQHIASLPRSGRSSPDLNHDFLLPVCKLHYPADGARPPSGEGGLLKIEIGLREFSAKLHALLHTHNGILQLDGFEYCYRAEYGNFPLPQNIHEGGVFVEHQSSYVPGVQIITSQPHCLGVKAIVWAQPQSDAGSDTASDTSGATRWKSPNLIQFSREVVELLKERPYCCLPYNDFSSAYHRHFGHACRVAEYGFTRLSNLLSAIPHVLQVMGSLSNRILTLTHRAQVKRFTQEVVKILKSTPDRAILVAQMPELYNRSFNRVWRLRDYGVSVLSDLLDDIPEGHICTNGEGDNIVLSLPVRERTADEKERTSQFAREVIKILRSRPHYRMPFTDFVPTYHRQFGRQCKLANYGFSKLIDLFEALPHIVQIFEKGTEKLLTLTEMEQRKVLSMQIISLLRAQQAPTFPPTLTKEPSKSTVDVPTLPIACLHVLFQQKYNFPLLPREFAANDIEELMHKLPHAVQVGLGKCGEKVVRLSDRKPLRLLSAQLLALLLDQNTDHFDVDQLHSLYAERYRENIVPEEYGFLSLSDVIRKALPGVIRMDIDASECFIRLKSLYQEARKIRSILLDNNSCMTLGEFSIAFRSKHGTTIDHESHGFRSMESLLRALPNIFVIKGFGMKKTVTLRNHMQYGPLSGTVGSNGGQNFANGTPSESIQASGDSSSCSKKQTSIVLTNSASTGDFCSEGEKKRKDIGLYSSDHPAVPWMAPPTRPLVRTYQNSKYRFQNGKSRNCRGNSTSTSYRYSRSKSSAVGQHSSCKFSMGGSTISTSTGQEYNEDRTPIRRGISMSVITLPSGSTPIASTSSCSSTSTRESAGSSASSECSIESIDSFSSDEECPTHPGSVLSQIDKQCHGPSSLPNSPFDSITGATAFVGPLPHVRNGCLQSDSNSPGRMQLAASFPTLAHI